MVRSFIALIFLLMLSCNARDSDKANAVLYLSNHSIDKFENAFLRVYANDRLILSDSVKNQYISFHWKDSAVRVPSGNFRLKVAVSSNGYELEKDTAVTYRDSLKVFVTFNFHPYYKRYRNPDIFKFVKGETSRLKEIADSLYLIKVLPNAEEYLNDTIPLKSSIEVSIK